MAIIFTFVSQANKRQFGKRTINSLSNYSCEGLFFQWQPHYTASATRPLFATFSLTVICIGKDWEIWTLHNFINIFTCKCRIRAETFPLNHTIPIIGIEGFREPSRGGTWVFFGWVCAAWDSKVAPRSKNISPKIDTLI